MIYYLEIEDLDTHQLNSMEADSESMLEELSARIKVAFDYSYDDYDCHEFSFAGHRYVPADMVGAVSEMMFETWEPTSESEEEPDWFEMYRSSDIPLSEAFTVIGSAIRYKQGYRTARITLVGRENEPANPNERFDKYDYLQDELS